MTEKVNKHVKSPYDSCFTEIFQNFIYNGVRKIY